MHKDRYLIVGGSAGIGLAVARQLQAGGAEVIIAARSHERFQLAASQLNAGTRFEIVDATDEKSITALFERVGQINHLVVTIKPSLPAGPFAENDLTAVRAAFDAKFWGQYQLTKAALPYLLPAGSIVLTSGIAACRSYPGYSAVSAMNAATEALTRALASELAPIRVNCVCPGFVNTAPPNPQRSEYVARLAPNLPLARPGHAEEIAQAYLYLLGNSYSTGTVLIIDGGACC